MNALFWFRRDLRLRDNHGLSRALREANHVLPVFIFDTNILSKLEDRNDARVTFIFDEILRLKGELESMGSSLLVRYGDPVDILREIVREHQIDRVYANHDYEPYSKERDAQAARMLTSFHVDFLTFKDQVIFEKDEVVKDDGKPYTVFTPYMKKWKDRLGIEPLPSYDSTRFRGSLFRTTPLPLLTLESMGFERSLQVFPSRNVDPGLIRDYDHTRDIPSADGTSRLGLHLRFGTISIRQLVNTAFQINTVFLNELVWREFYMMILWHFPHVITSSFRPQYDKIRWINDEDQFRAWCEGKTGYPIVDAGMRQLNQTGYMHNRLRMITASFLTKLLLIDWRWGEAYFARKLLDYELASNNGGWQWSAGTGCDAAPYFRIFNPDSQTDKFDPDLIFIRHWVPELDTEQYPERVVNYTSSRERAIRAYKEALG